MIEDNISLRINYRRSMYCSPLAAGTGVETDVRDGSYYVYHWEHGESRRSPVHSYYLSRREVRRRVYRIAFNDYNTSEDSIMSVLADTNNKCPYPDEFIQINY